MSGDLALLGTVLIVVQSLTVAAIVAQNILVDRRLARLEETVETLRQAAEPAAGQHEGIPELETTHDGTRPVSSHGVQPRPPQPSFRIVSPSRAKRDLERRFAQAAAARRTLDEAAKENT